MAATIARRRIGHILRCIHSSRTARLPVNSQASSEIRDYYYDIDQHGQLFLSNTKIRNFTSCYKDPAFLDFFYKRLKPLEFAKGTTDPATDKKHDKLKQEGYTFVSLCGPERNYIKSQDTPIVFRELIQQDSDWYLKYGGTLTTLFQPALLKVDERGYLYHPSPVVQRATRRRSSNVASSVERPSENPYGQYSLLRSELVVSNFSKSLEMSEDGSGSYEWLGSRRPIRHLQDGEAILGNSWVD